jgi:hypothetical protein
MPSLIVSGLEVVLLVAFRFVAGIAFHFSGSPSLIVDAYGATLHSPFLFFVKPTRLVAVGAIGAGSWSNSRKEN